ncbi:hypothetical protein TcasGA2_TC000454 [Tribolium castaneum]|uniref:Uncharacterized protein n=1 Tax=Tribolium castaneum TaxID=7070 RepID=D6WA69_TRICA|nr:hypothetical protein TcasGA2_TC000454 [Tribolium castaneum]
MGLTSPHDPIDAKYKEIHERTSNRTRNVLLCLASECGYTWPLKDLTHYEARGSERKTKNACMPYKFPVDKNLFPLPTHGSAVMQNDRLAALHALVSIIRHKRCEKTAAAKSLVDFCR